MDDNSCDDDANDDYYYYYYYYHYYYFFFFILFDLFVLQTVSYYPPNNRNLPNPDFESLVPSTALMASIFWMLVTWCLWFLPDILPPTAPEKP